VDEETGLTGAFAMKSDMLTENHAQPGQEDFGSHRRMRWRKDSSPEPIKIKQPRMKLSCGENLVFVGAFRGRYEQRGNAIKSNTSVMESFSHEFTLRYEGGDKHNAIPWAYAKLALKTKMALSLQSRQKKGNL
jgi:hypothetical protein